MSCMGLGTPLSNHRLIVLEFLDDPRRRGPVAMVPLIAGALLVKCGG